MDNAEIIRIGVNELPLLKEFISDLGSATDTFRYFNSRPFSVVENHICTILLIISNKPAGYGHLDPEGDTTWLGIAVLPEYQGSGFGKLIMNKLFEIAIEEGIKEIKLSVDNSNLSAWRFYEKLGFQRIKILNDLRYYTLNLSSIPDRK